ncbi:hypothetical protein A2645_00030 [Candidatus Nomurabacteria bacterium RIFCSPHIGHO2_01_FULL_39_9]|uniref:GEVED domain-containing protein n=1 Tax=Candidatus Nomurabacteria bacterium RIFCSPHIGHO2_01_FULL_39_9 TaxID=1801735 RepID=A0A1F6UVH7_9BACT|nr:MAG: hypothetical protein A2645_00030 [Candidatus Nomurabacteria bacterium RIFCSPHIGHO2_01_FULL_39_9]
MKTLIQKHFLFISAVVILGVGIFWYLISSPKPQAEVGGGTPIVQKIEEMLFIKADENCQEPFHESGQVSPLCLKETILLEGQVGFQQAEEGYFFRNATLQGRSQLLEAELALNVNGNFVQESKFSNLDFPAEARLTKEMQFLFPNLFLAYGNSSPMDYVPFTEVPFTKIEEGIIKRFPPFWGNPLCWIADPNSEDPNKRPIAVYKAPHLQDPVGWIIKNCDQFWPEEYYGSNTTPPSPQSFPTESSEHNVISKVELQFENELDSVVLQGPTTIRQLPGESGVIDTEMLAMDLTGGGLTLVSDPNQLVSRGKAERTFSYPLDFPADSFFDVFFDITIPESNHDGDTPGDGEILDGDGFPTTTIQKLKPYSSFEGNWQPGVRLTSRIKEIPWWWSTFCSSGQIYLYTEEQINNVENFYPGETEPARIIYNFCQEIIPYDFGDAPDDAQAPKYPTLLSNNGARHLMFSAYNGFPILGSLIDADSDGQPSSGADGDNFLDINDEADGVLFDGSSFNIGGTLRGTASINGTGFLNAWADFNIDGDFADENEQIIIDEQVLTGNFEFNANIPEDAHFGFSYARFRLSRQEGLSFDGEARDGEVEDYKIELLPALSEGTSSGVDDEGNLSVFKGEALVTKLPPGTLTLGMTVDAEPGKALVSGVVLLDGKTKPLYIEIKDGTRFVCVIDAEVTSLAELPEAGENCNGTIIECPNDEDSYPCEIDEPYYIIRELRNSGGSEVTPPAAPPAAPVAGGAVSVAILQQMSQQQRLQEQQQLQQQLAQEVTSSQNILPSVTTPPMPKTAKIGKGSVWAIARGMLGPTATTPELIQLTKRILLLNNVCEKTWKMTGCKYNSRRLPYGFQFILP